MINELPLVSIAMSTYNGEDFLTAQLDSIVNQTYKNIEVIITDDCSADATPNIIREYTQKHNFKFYINDKNLGFVKNFEKAVSLCSGEYIALADQDDIWLPNKIERLVAEIKDHTMICSDSTLIDENDEVISQSSNKYCGFALPKFSKQKEILIFRNFVTGCTAMFHKSLVEQALPIPEKCIYHDWWFAIVASKMNGIKYLDEQLIRYRKHSSNNTGYKSLWQRIVWFLLPQSKQSIIKEYDKRQKIPEMLLDCNLSFNDKERKLIIDAHEYFKTILNIRSALRNLLFEYRNKDIIFSKPSYFYLALLRYMVLPLWKLY